MSGGETFHSALDPYWMWFSCLCSELSEIDNSKRKVEEISNLSEYQGFKAKDEMNLYIFSKKEEIHLYIHIQS